MAVIAHRPASRPVEAAGASARPAGAGGRAPYALRWRWLPWTAPRLTLGPNLRPQTRLELALCALFRCQTQWSAAALVERLGRAPEGSDDSLALVAGTGSRCIGPGAAWDAVEDWLERGVLAQVLLTRRVPASSTAAAPRASHAEPRASAARFPS